MTEKPVEAATAADAPPAEFEALVNLRIVKDTTQQNANAFAQLTRVGRNYIEIVHMDLHMSELVDKANAAAAEYDRALRAYRTQFPSTPQ